MFDKFFRVFKGWIDGAQGATALEYGLIAGGIALVILSAVFLTGGSLSALFSTIAGAMSWGAAEVAAR